MGAGDTVFGVPDSVSEAAAAEALAERGRAFHLEAERAVVEARARGLKRPLPVSIVQGMPWFRFTGLLIALAMLLSPLSMIGRAHAMSAGGIELAQIDHCAGMPVETPKSPDRSTHCFVACSAVAPSAALMVARLPPVAEVAIAKILAGPSGRSPTADPPPPRFS